MKKVSFKLKEIMKTKTVVKRIKNYSNYGVSRTGRIYSFKNKVFLKPTLFDGYHRVMLYNDKPRKTHLVHRVVAKAFIPNPNGHTIVNHKDGNKINNSVENLEWCSNEENIQHAIDNGLLQSHKRCVFQFTRKGEYIASFESIVAAAKNIQVSETSIRQVCHGERETCKGFCWSFERDFDLKRKHSLKPVLQIDPTTNDIINEYESINAAYNKTQRKYFESL